MSQVKVNYILKRPKKVASNLITLTSYERVTIFNQHKPSAIFMSFRKTAQTQIAASDQGLHCLLTECSFKI